ncbi:hypothetical protein GCM10010412_063190 [Nonomuraea recticatena]|uniref:Uncharacterized protein n=1 Tax=Nonomuraea recticatena TaxID=46178 RepID=A0ABN3SKS8_9ACTN
MPEEADGQENTKRPPLPSKGFQTGRHEATTLPGMLLGRRDEATKATAFARALSDRGNTRRPPLPWAGLLREVSADLRRGPGAAALGGRAPPRECSWQDEDGRYPSLVIASGQARGWACL